MLILGSGDTLSGKAAAATALTVTIFGVEINETTGVETFKRLYQGQPSASAATLYTTPATTQTLIKSIMVVNPTGVARTIELWAVGTADANALLPAISVDAGAMAVYTDGWKFYASTGGLKPSSLSAADLTGTTLPSAIVSAPGLATIGTLVAGAVPASLVTAGTFGAGAYVFPAALGVTGLATFNGGATVASGQTLTLTGATVAGTPTWSSAQAITISTATQASITTMANLVTVGALNAGSITSGFGSIDVGADAISGGAISGTSLTSTTLLSSVTALATPSALAATAFNAFASTVSGAAIMGYGTTNDVALMNRAGTVCLGVGPNTTVVNIPGSLSVVGAVGGAAASFTTGAFSGNLTVGASTFVVTAATGAVAISGTIASTVAATASSSAFYVNSTSPSYAWRVSGSAADEKLWDIVGGSTTLQFRAVNDAINATNVWLTATRSGIASVAVSLSGSLAITGALTGVTTLNMSGALTTNGGVQTFLANDSAGAGFRYVVVPNA